MGRSRWWERWRVVVFSASFAVACGETSSNHGDAPDASGIGTTSSSTQAGGNGTVSTMTSTSAATTGVTNGVTAVSAGGAGVATSTDAVTAVSVGGASVVTSTDGAVSTTSHAGGSGGSAGGGAEPECSSDDDCRLFSDCCTCAAYPASGEAPTVCPAVCARGPCLEYEVERALCLAGRCTVATPHSCSPLPVQCEGLPPECPAGTLPSVEGMCWTGDCIPSEFCGTRPDCSSCAANEVCFRGFNDAFGTPYYCMPRPVTCTDQATCDCAGQLCEALGFLRCTDADDGIMQCSPS